MVIKYYNDINLSYSLRKRYKTFNFVQFNQEVQKSVLLGDGAKTSIKTSVNNICKYVTIDDTRWFVLSYTYLNGKQVILNLQRDVIGEFGIESFVGKIERGYTESFLRNRKELTLNQILKNRKPLKSKYNTYGNYTVSTHDNECWGIIYLTKPSNVTESTVTIPIPGFEPQVTDYPPLAGGSYFYNNKYSDVYYEFSITDDHYKYIIRIKFSYSAINGWFHHNSIDKSSSTESANIFVRKNNTDMFTTEELNNFVNDIVNNIIDGVSSFILPNPNKHSFSYPEYDYDNVVIEDSGKYYKYSEYDISDDSFGSVKDKEVLDFIFGIAQSYWEDNSSLKIQNYDNIYFESRFVYTGISYSIRELTPSESGSFEFSLEKNFVDEPFYILVFPLYDVTITGKGETKIVERKNAFQIFNTVIEKLSGENPYLVDAQIYPYCPSLTDVASEIGVSPESDVKYPFFYINSNTFTTQCQVQLLPYSDIKKEYIKREYSIISPEQSGKFNFNFYDYTNKIELNEELNDGKNYAYLNILIKTAFKPYSIISSAVIIPDDDSLIGITYNSDLRGCQPSSNGFECSLSSNAFETYKRQNSNYQQIFALQKEELQKQHSVERVNEITGSIVNTVSAASMGAIAGANIGDSGLFGNLIGTKSAGAAIGASVAGGVVGAAMASQYAANESLRQYEEYLQQQNFDLNIQTIKNIPNSINRISSFNEIILQDFYYVIETYECSEYESLIVDNFISSYSYGIGVIDYVSNYFKNGWFLRSSIISSNLQINLHNIAEKDLMGGIYFYE